MSTEQRTLEALVKFARISAAIRLFVVGLFLAPETITSASSQKAEQVHYLLLRITSNSHTRVLLRLASFVICFPDFWGNFWIFSKICFLEFFVCAGQRLHGFGDCCGGHQAGIVACRAARAQFHDGHSAY